MITMTPVLLFEMAVADGLQTMSQDDYMAQLMPQAGRYQWCRLLGVSSVPQKTALKASLAEPWSETQQLDVFSQLH
jgi:hypothetical protein